MRPTSYYFIILALLFGCSPDPPPKEVKQAKVVASLKRKPQVISLVEQLSSVEISGVSRDLVRTERIGLTYSGHPHGSDHRYGIVVPAGAILRYQFVPESSSVLDTGVGLLAEDPPVEFEIAAVQEGGDRSTLYSGSKNSDKLWEDVHISLDDFSGKQITLELVSKGEMVWSEPRIHNGSNSGKTVLLVVLDTVSARYMAPYGPGKENITPNFSRLGKSSAVFKNAYAPTGWTLPAFASIFTGYTPFEHRAGEYVSNNPLARRPLGPETKLVTEILNRKEWVSHAWVNNPYLTVPFGLSRGYNRYSDYGTRTSERASELAVGELVNYLKKPAGYNRFIFFHFMDPHGHYSPTKEQLSKFLTKECTAETYIGMDGVQLYRNLLMGKVKLGQKEQQCYRILYDAMLNYTDLQFGRLLDAFNQLPNSGDNLLILTADHGEEFWQHGRYEHGHSIYDELLHVPLMIRGKGIDAKVVKEPVTLMDLFPTALDFIGMDDDRKIQASSLLPLAADGDGAEYPSAAILTGGVLYGVDRYAIAEGDWKYIYNVRRPEIPEDRAADPGTRYELYYTAGDAEEQKNLFQKEFERGQRLHEKLLAQLFGRTVDHIWLSIRLPEGSGSARLSVKVRNNAQPVKLLPRLVEYVYPNQSGEAGVFELNMQAEKGGFTTESDSSWVVYNVKPLEQWEEVEVSLTTKKFGSVTKRISSEDAKRVSLGGSKVEQPEIQISYSKGIESHAEVQVDEEWSSKLEEDLHSLGYLG